LSGVTQSPGVTLTATYMGTNKTTQVRVLGVNELPGSLALSPTMITMPAHGSTMVSAQTDIPAPTGGLVVSLSVTPSNAGTVPVTVTIPADQTSAFFTFTDAGVVSASSIHATAGGLNAQADVTIAAASGHLVINEVDYDSVGTDSAEFIEILNPTASPVSLATISVAFINGSNNAEYDRSDLVSLGTLQPGQYLVIGSTSVLAGVPASALKIHFKGAADTDRVQNGAPDGLALIDTSTLSVIDALSYEGSITAGVINGLGMHSLVEGAPTSAADSNTQQGSLCRLPDGTDTDDAATDWGFSPTPTPGTQNQ
jgi:hypothetical protein